MYGIMKRMAKVYFAELSFDALSITEESKVFERVEHEGLDGSRQVTFVYDDFYCPGKSSRQCCSFEEFETYFRKEIEQRFKKEILRLERLGSRSCKTQLQQTAARRQRMPELRRIA